MTTPADFAARASLPRASRLSVSDPVVSEFPQGQSASSDAKLEKDDEVYSDTSPDQALDETAAVAHTDSEVQMSQATDSLLPLVGWDSRDSEGPRSMPDGLCASSPDSPAGLAACVSMEITRTTALGQPDSPSAVPEQEGQQNVKIRETLESIFEYYGVSGQSSSVRRLSSARFQRMALEAALIDDQLTTAKVDLIFRGICGTAPHMSLEQFLNAVVRLVAVKYPNLPRQAGVRRLYDDHLASFAAPTAGAFHDLDSGLLAVCAAARPGLQTLYEGYFGFECRSNGRSRPARQRVPQSTARQAQPPSEAQSAFTRLLSDFEVTPDLAPKPVVFAIFREVSRKEAPSEVRERLLGGGVPGTPGPGQHFTYVHFAAALALTSRRCFADEGGVALARLLEWMDASKGRMIFGATYPGHMPGGAAAFKLTPEQLPEGLLARAHRAGHTAQAHRPTANTDIRSARGGVTSGPQPTLRVPEDNSGIQAVESSCDNGHLEDDLAQRPGQFVPWVRRVVQQVFGHYASIGNPLNRTHLSTLQFTRCLRDCGLVSSQSEGAVSFRFVPSNRRSSSSSKLTFTAPDAAGGSRSSGCDVVQRSGSTGALRASRAPLCGSSSSASKFDRSSAWQLPPDESDMRNSTAFSVSPSKMLGLESSGILGASLPLQVFSESPLTQVEADLLFVQSTRRAQGSSGNSRPKASVKSGNTTRHHMTLSGFGRALDTLAHRCAPFLHTPVTTETELEVFCEQVLLPLQDNLQSTGAQEVASAAALLSESEAVDMLERGRIGLERVYRHYLHETSSQRPHWTPESMTRFAQDFELSVEVGTLPLQRIFRDCAHFESCASAAVPLADGRLLFPGFQLALAVLAQKVHVVRGGSPFERLVALLHRLNTLASASGFQGPVSRLEPLIPGLPPSPAAARAAASNAVTRDGRRQRQAPHVSWRELMGS